MAEHDKAQLVYTETCTVTSDDVLPCGKFIDIPENPNCIVFNAGNKTEKNKFRRFIERAFQRFIR